MAVELNEKDLEALIADLTARGVEYELVNDHKVACNGNGGALGHPKTYYEVGEKGSVACGYCDKVFIYKP